MSELKLGSLVAIKYCRPSAKGISFDDYIKNERIEIIEEDRLAVICGITEEKWGKTGFSVVFLDNGELLYSNTQQIKLIAQSGEFLVNALKKHFEGDKWHSIETAPLRDVGILIGAYFKDDDLYWIQDLVYHAGYGYRTQSGNNATHWKPLPKKPEN